MWLKLVTGEESKGWLYHILFHEYSLPFNFLIQRIYGGLWYSPWITGQRKGNPCGHCSGKHRILQLQASQVCILYACLFSECLTAHHQLWVVVNCKNITTIFIALWALVFDKNSTNVFTALSIYCFFPVHNLCKPSIILQYILIIMSMTMAWIPSAPGIVSLMLNTEYWILICDRCFFKVYCEYMTVTLRHIITTIVEWMN